MGGMYSIMNQRSSLGKSSNRVDIRIARQSEIYEGKIDIYDTNSFERSSESNDNSTKDRFYHFDQF